MRDKFCSVFKNLFLSLGDIRFGSNKISLPLALANGNKPTAIKQTF